MHKKIFLFLFFLILLYCTFQFFYTTRIKIDKIYIVNLEREHIRRDNIKNQLYNKIIPPYEFFSAIDYQDMYFQNADTGELISAKDLKVAGKIHGKYKIICSKEWDGDFDLIEFSYEEIPSRMFGEIACMCSHKRLWEIIAKSNYNNVLILEDDVSFIPYFEYLLAIMNYFVPKDYDILYLSVYADFWHYNARVRIKGFNKITNIFNNYFRYVFFKRIRREATTTAAYVINPSSAQKIITNIKFLNGNPFLVADGVLGSFVSKKILRAYVTKPLLADQNPVLPNSISSSSF